MPQPPVDIHSPNAGDTGRHAAKNMNGPVRPENEAERQPGHQPEQGARQRADEPWAQSPARAEPLEIDAGELSGGVDEPKNPPNDNRGANESSPPSQSLTRQREAPEQNQKPCEGSCENDQEDAIAERFNCDIADRP